MDPVYTLEWSQRQQAFHIQPLHETVRKNRDAFVQNRRTDYIVIHVGTQAECQLGADTLRSTAERRAREAA
jgi:hypothetical protein